MIPNCRGRILQYRPDYARVEMEPLGLGNTHTPIVVLENSLCVALDVMASTYDFHEKSASKLMPSNFNKLTRSM